MTSNPSFDLPRTLPRRPKPVHRTPAQREAFLEQFARSDLSAKAFARQHGIADSTFTDWVNKASHTNGLQNQKHQASSFPFAEVVVETSASDSLRSSPGTCVHLPGQAWVELDGKPEQAQHIAQLLKALQSS